jgi:hypothetical protein
LNGILFTKKRNRLLIYLSAAVPDPSIEPTDNAEEDSVEAAEDGHLNIRISSIGRRGPASNFSAIHTTGGKWSESSFQ